MKMGVAAGLSEYSVSSSVNYNFGYLAYLRGLNATLFGVKTFASYYSSFNDFLRREEARNLKQSAGRRSLLWREQV